MGLKMKSKCELCGEQLATDAGGVYICSSERTYCGHCAQKSHYNCPRCGGELVRRPRAPKIAKK